MSKKSKIISRFLLLSILNYQATFSVFSTDLLSLTTKEPAAFVTDSMTVIQITNKQKKKRVTMPVVAIPIIAKQETFPSHYEHSQLGKRMARLSGILLYGERGGKR
ncbi:hypothetical protein [Enterococcus larvae]|uniref:hypothetical protein n=1 Tax=Enterococcus larvae TaxID=2794352 RepID=UPI003F3D6AE4